MCASSARLHHRFVRRLILASFLLLPWPALAEEAPTLPLSKIVLYSSGVGDFQQHDGSLKDRARLDLRFNVLQINDILKSLVVQDFGGGKVSTVTYGSRDPVTKTLGAFGVNLNGNPTLGQILTQVRGEPVEVARRIPSSAHCLAWKRKRSPSAKGRSAASWNRNMSLSSLRKDFIHSPLRTSNTSD